MSDNTNPLSKKLINWKEVSLEHYNKEWNKRTRRISELIPKSCKSVLEFGAGTQYLKECLSKNCDYTPSDIVDRGPNTIVCDLNESLPKLDKKYEVVVFSGVLEYIKDIGRLVAYLYDYTDMIITSYNFSKNRKHFVHDYRIDKLVEIFENAGWEYNNAQKVIMDGYPNNDQVLFKFTKKEKIS